MSFLFGKRKTPAELLRENKRMLDKSIREIERERQGLQTQEKKLITEIKKSAKQGQMGAVRIMAKDLIRTRHQIEKFYKLKSQLQGVALRIQTLKSTQAMGEAMKGVTKAMGQMNRQMNLPSLQRIMQEFEMQNEKMEMVTEVMGEAIDDAMEGDEEEEETDELVNQVLDEIGIDMNSEVCLSLNMFLCYMVKTGQVHVAITMSHFLFCLYTAIKCTLGSSGCTRCKDQGSPS
uniref:Vacuolar protein sorting-associated protein 2 homolog 1-like n=1 Tax=Nelumbo nucifera TaxID=4432 RepID=A0A822ZJK5_NELNU|nr:TPA_asm: hypothetical protein HUJ06_001789 [Nelumbo nucifera]